MILLLIVPMWRNGIRGRFKICSRQLGVGSSPIIGTFWRDWRGGFGVAVSWQYVRIPCETRLEYSTSNLPKNKSISVKNLSNIHKKVLEAVVAAMGLGPGIGDGLPSVPVIADLDADIGKGMTVIKIPSFMLLVKFDEDLFVVPGNSGHIGFSTVTIELFIIDYAPIGWRLYIELKEGLDYFHRPFLKSLDIEVHFGADQVL